MKAHIVRVFGIWHCWRPSEKRGEEVICGLGYTPDAAYEDWMRLIAKTEER